MAKRHIFVLSTIVFLSLLALHHLRADDSSDKSQRQRIAFLIGKLASNNRAPNVDAAERYTFPRDYDVEAQALVYLAAQQLLFEGSAAFDALIEHFSDTRYSYTRESPEGFKDFTVGQVCRKIFVRSIECHETLIPRISADQSRLLWKHPTTPEEWWSRNRNRPLWQIQIEAIEAQIAVMKSLDYATASPPRPYVKKVDENRFNELRAESVEIMERMRAAILGTKTPYRSLSIDGNSDSMAGLPWPTRSWNK